MGMAGRAFEVTLVSTGMVDLPPRSGGGVEAYVWDIALMLDRLKVPNAVVADVRDGAHLPPGSSNVPVHSVVDRFPLRPYQSVFAHLLGGSASARAAVRWLGHANGPRVLHLNEEVSAASLCRSHPDVPKVFTLHNPPPVGTNGTYGTVEKTVRWANSAAARRWIWSRVDVTIALSGWIRDYLVANGVPPDRVAELSLPIDTARFVPPEGEVRAHDPTILYVGKLDHRKNLPALLEAFVQLPADVRLVVVGQGPLNGYLVDFIEAHDLEERIDWRPTVSAPRLIQLYQRAWTLCHPSSLEARPRVILEAAACGLPAVLPDSFLYADLSSAGFVQAYDPESVQDLANQLAAFLSDGARRQAMGRRAREYALREASYDVFGRRLLAVYERAIDSPRSE